MTCRSAKEPDSETQTHPGCHGIMSTQGVWQQVRHTQRCWQCWLVPVQELIHVFAKASFSPCLPTLSCCHRHVLYTSYTARHTPGLVAHVLPLSFCRQHYKLARPQGWWRRSCERGNKTLPCPTAALNVTECHSTHTWKGPTQDIPSLVGFFWANVSHHIHGASKTSLQLHICSLDVTTLILMLL